MALGFASRGKHYLMTQLRQNNPPGKSLLIFRTHVKPCREKYSAFARAQISSLASPVSPDERGGSRLSRTRGGTQWTRKLRKTDASRRGRRTAWSRRPDAGVKSAGNIPRATVARKPGHRGEHEISRKPLRRESRIASAGPVCSCAFSVSICTRDRGCSAHPAFPAPSFFSEGGNRRKARAHRAARSGICVCDESGYCESDRCA